MVVVLCVPPVLDGGPPPFCSGTLSYAVVLKAVRDCLHIVDALTKRLKPRHLQTSGCPQIQSPVKTQQHRKEKGEQREKTTANTNTPVASTHQPDLDADDRQN